MTARPDVLVANHGSIALVRPVTDAAERWLDDHVDPDAPTFGRAIVVEPRYLPDLIAGMTAAGLAVR